MKKKVQKALGQSVLSFPSDRVGTPEATAKRGVARMETTVSGHRVKMPVTLSCPKTLRSTSWRAPSARGRTRRAGRRPIMGLASAVLVTSASSVVAGRVTGKRRKDKQMEIHARSLRSIAVIVVLIAAIPLAHAQSPGDFAGEPDNSMAAAHESFLKGDMNTAAAQIQKAASFVKEQGDKVAKSAQGGVKKAGTDLEQLGRDVKTGTVKSGGQMKTTFAQVDHQLAIAWHTTAEQASKSGQDSTAALKNAAAGVEGAAKWSGTQLKQGAQASVDGMKKVGQGVKLGADDVGKFLSGIGQGIADIGQQLK